VKRWWVSPVLATVLVLLLGAWVTCRADEAKKSPPDLKEQVDALNEKVGAGKDKDGSDINKVADSQVSADSAWMLVSTALVMLMVPGLALFYGGMVRRKNVLATMMQSMVALAVVGVYWVAIGYALAFGDPVGDSKPSFLGFSAGLIFLQGVNPKTLLPGTNIPVYLHVMFQGMFAIITPALISGAVAERIRFKPYCLFLILWITFVYCPLAHWVWAQDWNWANSLLAQPNADILAKSGKNAVGWLAAKGTFIEGAGALDFAGGTVVHIAAGLSSLAAILVLRRRLGYPEHAIHPNSMVLTLTGAGLLWFGWFGFNGGSAGSSGPLAVSAFTATQCGAAAAGLSWMLVEWLHRGKPTALGLASGIVAGLVAITPASGFVSPLSGLIIGLLAGAICYTSVSLKPTCKYDDSLDAFGVHGVGGFLGAVLTGVFCSTKINPDGADGLAATGATSQLMVQLIAACVSVVFAFGLSFVLVKLVDILIGFTTDEASETEGLDLTEHGEVGFDLGLTAGEAPAAESVEPRAARVPPSDQTRFSVVVDGIKNGDLLHAWSELCMPSEQPPSPDFKKVYHFMTTVKGNRFHFRGGDPEEMRRSLQALFQGKLNGAPLRVNVEK
jgi:ammonium transporter